jgi:hypothetical protein
VRRPAKSQTKQNAYVGPDAEGPFRGVCTAAVGFCCRTAPLPPLPPPPPVAPLNPGKVSSKFFGVFINKSNKKWRAEFRHNGKRVNLGNNFDTEIAAAKAVAVWLRENGRAAEANFDEDGNFVPRVSTQSSKYRGVTWSKMSNQWQAQIKVAGKNENLGYFDDEAEAARAFDTRAAALGRPTNFDLNGVEIDYSA